MVSNRRCIRHQLAKRSLHQVELSTYYYGKQHLGNYTVNNYTFPDIAREILDMSINKDVYLIGLVEIEKKPKGLLRASLSVSSIRHFA